jgi:hypothetical protein
MVGCCERTSACRRYDALECRILGHLDGQGGTASAVPPAE